MVTVLVSGQHIVGLNVQVFVWQAVTLYISYVRTVHSHNFTILHITLAKHNIKLVLKVNVILNKPPR